jgi:hypothetical protein
MKKETIILILIMELIIIYFIWRGVEKYYNWYFGYRNHFNYHKSLGEWEKNHARN